MFDRMGAAVLQNKQKRTASDIGRDKKLLKYEGS